MDKVKSKEYAPEEILLHAAKKRKSAAENPEDALRVKDEKSSDLRGEDVKTEEEDREEDSGGGDEEEKEEDDDDDDDDVEPWCHHVAHGYYLVKGKMDHGMEDYIVAETRVIDGHELGLYAIFDGHSGRDVADHLQSHLFDNIISQPDFWKTPDRAIKRAYKATDNHILKEVVGSRGGSTAVTAILIDKKKLVVANVGDSRAILCSRKGEVKQLTVDHKPDKEKALVESKGGFITKRPGNVPRVDGQLAMSRAFGDGKLKDHISVVPDIRMEAIDKHTKFLILASDGLWTVMSNEEAFDCIQDITDAKEAAKKLIKEALARGSKDDISCIVVSFS